MYVQLVFVDIDAHAVVVLRVQQVHGGSALVAARACRALQNICVDAGGEAGGVERAAHARRRRDRNRDALLIIICGNQRRWRGRRAGPCGIFAATLMTTVLRSATRPGGVELLVLVLDVLRTHNDNASVIEKCACVRAALQNICVVDADEQVLCGEALCALLHIHNTTW
jgi:hypothetical protein